MSFEQVEKVVREAVAKRSPRNVVLYHGNCSDGFGAAWAASVALGRDCTFVPAAHGKVNIALLEGENLFILDFCFSLEELRDLERRFKHVVVLDHHVKSEAIIREFRMGVFDNDRSGTGITWDVFHKNRPRPNLVRYVEDQDLWNKALKQTDEVACITETTPYEFRDWDAYARELDTDFDAVVARGKPVLKYKRHMIERLKSSSRLTRFRDYEVPVVNCVHAFASELGNALAQGQPFAMIWRQAGDGQFLYSLRSTSEGEDVEVIASQMGGGGHKHAAAIASDRLLV